MPLIKKFLVSLCALAATVSAAALPARAADGEIIIGEVKVSNLTVRGNYVIARPCSAVTFENVEVEGVVSFGGSPSGEPVTVNIGAGCILGGLIINRPAALHNEGRIKTLAVMSETRIHSRGQIDLAVIEAKCDLKAEDDTDSPTIIIADGTVSGATGLISVFGDEYYAGPDGALASGLVTADGKTYYFDSTHLRRSGLVSFDGKLYNLARDGSLTAGWAEIGGKTYYFNEDGAAAAGAIVEIGGKRYCFGTDGAMRTGIVASSDGGSYFFFGNGELAVNTHLGDYRAGGDGRLVYKLTGNGELDGAAAGILAGIASGGMPDNDKLFAIYRWMSANIRWRVTSADLPNGFTPEKTAELALHAAKNRKGECEHFAALE
ncbi:MAG: hypothetical protein LBJ84_01745, partial [Oscillospiraceae bacterium]|nr:hypothetical protein [Oscillospiraceae bacterium]